MAGSILQIGNDELWRMLGEINPVELLAYELTGDAPADHERQQRLVSESASTRSMVVEDLRTRKLCQLPVVGVRMIQGAAMASLAARKLLTHGSVTLGIIGPAPEVYLCLSVIVRHVFDIGHVVVCPMGARRAEPVEPAVLDQLDRAGIGLLVTDNVHETAFGANFLVIAGDRREHLEIEHLIRGALLVNLTCHDLPDSLVDDVDQIYVDDAAPLRDNRHRHFVRRHLAGTGCGREQLRIPEGWHRHRNRIEADLRQVLAGEHPGRTHLDDSVLVEPLRGPAPDLALCGQLLRTALEHGLGAWLPADTSLQ
jgi:ornithine cyclodeaminase/alanine dehydrogenase-like protein (mu-crystallin family)